MIDGDAHAGLVRLADALRRLQPTAPAMPTTFAVLGDGAWGTAIALLLAQNPTHRVTLWSAREENGRLLRERRENVRLLPGVPIPPSASS